MSIFGEVNSGNYWREKISINIIRYILQEKTSDFLHTHLHAIADISSQYKPSGDYPDSCLRATYVPPIGHEWRGHCTLKILLPINPLVASSQPIVFLEFDELVTRDILKRLDPKAWNLRWKYFYQSRNYNPKDNHDPELNEIPVQPSIKRGFGPVTTWSKEPSQKPFNPLNDKDFEFSALPIDQYGIFQHQSWPGCASRCMEELMEPLCTPFSYIRKMRGKPFIMMANCIIASREPSLHAFDRPSYCKMPSINPEAIFSRQMDFILDTNSNSPRSDIGIIGLPDTNKSLLEAEFLFSSRYSLMAASPYDKIIKHVDNDEAKRENITLHFHLGQLQHEIQLIKWKIYQNINNYLANYYMPHYLQNPPPGPHIIGEAVTYGQVPNGYNLEYHEQIPQPNQNAGNLIPIQPQEEEAPPAYPNDEAAQPAQPNQEAAQSASVPVYARL